MSWYEPSARCSRRLTPMQTFWRETGTHEYSLSASPRPVADPAPIPSTRAVRPQSTGRGRVGRAVMAWLSPVEGLASGSSLCRRIPVSPGVEVLMDEQHPALRLNSDPTVIAEAIRHALTGIVGLEPMMPPVDPE